MDAEKTAAGTPCRICREGAREGFETPISMAFQPIIDLRDGSIFAHEALVRGCNGEGAGEILGQVDERNRYAFDQRCRVEAIEHAARIGIRECISINFMPNAVYEPATCIRTTLKAAERSGWPLDRIIFELTETEQIDDLDHVRHIIREYRRFGFRTAIDDFGSGFAGLALLADLQPDLLKIDMEIVRHIDTDTPRQSIVQGIISTARQLDITVIAEGIETEAERDCLIDMGILLHQGYLYARPAFQSATAPGALTGLPEASHAAG